MNPSFQFDADGVSDLQVLCEDGERVFCRGWRADGGGGRSAVLAVVPALERPPPAILDRLAHEYELRDELDAAWAARPLAFAREGGRTALLLEDPGGEPLERLACAPMETGRFLRLAIGVAAAICKAHQNGLVHKDVKPANILVNCADGLTRLTGFGIASRLPRERQAPGPPEVIAGTLAYMAPEQTGRMNRSIDSRSDLYALGVTFYRMLTGRLPFSAGDPMEWFHCHIARKPVAPAERLESVPAAISEIVTKLLAKTAEERYQTAAGVERDLWRCLAEWERDGRIKPFVLGEHDVPHQLMIREKLYGREREVAALLAAFDRVVASGAPELVLVSGYSGIGKSSVVDELHKALVPSRGLFASGKFDQYKRDIPYATLAQAFQSLIRSLLGKSEAELSRWRASVAEALGPNGQLMVTLIPDLEPLIGPQPPAPELPPQDAQRRFQLVFGRLLGVFARPEHPLALFLDDLQWLDAATLGLLEYLATQPELRHLLLIGAYRDNEVTSVHPLMLRLAAIRSAGGRVQEIVLAPLGLDDVGRLVADTLQCAPARAAPLTRLVQEKTAGNPFFANQFLNALAEEGLLTVDHGATRWTWDLKRIHAKGYTDNVVELMVGKVHRLPAATQVALRQLSCLGNSAAISTLSLVQGGGEAALDAALWDAVRAGLVLRHEGSYRFLHDRVQEAAYALIPEGDRPAAHLATGRLLSAAMPPDAIEERVFEIVSQLNRGAALITSGEERERLAELNLIAGRRAKQSTAHAAALKYFANGGALLLQDSWERQHELAFSLELQQAECEFLTGDHIRAEQRLALLSDRANDSGEHAAIACLRIDILMTLGRPERSVEVGLDYLRSAGVAWPLHPARDGMRQEFERIWQRLGQRPIHALISLPLMEDRGWQAQMNVLSALLPPALMFDENLVCLIVARMANVSMERGNTDGSCLAYVWLGMLLGPYFDNYHAASQFGQLGLDLVEKRGLARFRARVYLDFTHVVNPWTQHVRFGPELVRRALNVANEVGDLTFAAYSSCNLISALLAAGAPLAEVQQEAERRLEFARQMHFGLIVDTITGQLRLITAMRGLSPTLGLLDGRAFAESQFERRLDQDPALTGAIVWYWVRQLQGSVFAGDKAGAMAAATKVEPFLWTLPSHLEIADYHFYVALARAASYESAPAQEQPELLHALRRHQTQLSLWAQNCPNNFDGRAALVDAEIARIERREFEAQRLYERSIGCARSNALVHDEALANELAARFYAAHGFEKIAGLYLQDARACYARWGAEGKVRQLNELYPHLRTEERPPAPTSTITAPVESLDLATVIRVSQAVSGEIVLEKLIDTLMRTAIEQAGAERGVLVLSSWNELRIAAEAATSGDTVIVELRDEPVTAAALPESVLHFVVRTNESVILDDAMAKPPFDEDPYIRGRRARSILCVPLINQAKQTGLLYLENNLARGSFAPGRTAVLKLLASQAAIALENTHLYRDLAEREAKIRRLVDANIIGIFIRSIAEEVDGPIVEANDAFLLMVGYDREDLNSGAMSWASLTPPEWREGDARAAAELKMTGIVPALEKEYFRKDGSRVPVLVGAASLENGTFVVAFVLDLTERKFAETALRDSEQRYRETQMQLAHANRIATMGQLTASIAHEVNQPIAATVANAQSGLRWLSTEPPNLDEARQAFGRIVRDGDRAGAVVGRIRSLIKKAPPSDEHVDINAAIREVIALTRSEAAKSGVLVQTEFFTGLPLVRGDRVELQQVILNLMLNAIEAMSEMSEGSRELLITTGKTEPSEVHVAVRDSGSGLAPTALEHLFEAFHTTKPSGLGLGLSICRSIIEAHGGQLWASANLPRGAVFQFTLPGHPVVASRH